MSGRFSITIFVGAMLLLLVALNAASYVRVEREAELELRPDRSTLNAGASGTRALYEFLSESGQRVMRWRDPVAALARVPEGARPTTFVIIGQTRVEFKPEEITRLLEWVEAGGRLVIIDRTPHSSFIESATWRVATSDVSLPQRDVRADDVQALTNGARQLAPLQPTLLTRDVAAIAPSRYASRLIAARKSDDEIENEQSKNAPSGTTVAPVVVVDEEDENATGDATSNENATGGGTVGGRSRNTNERAETADESEMPPPRPLPTATNEQRIPYGDPRTAATPSNDAATDTQEQFAPPQTDAPVVHAGDERGALLVDFTRGSGRIIVLSDPFIVTNLGIARADNLQLAANVITSAGGLIAFDEFHQGRGTTRNELAAYFAGTPVLAMCAQLFLIAAAVAWTRARRFGRPLPAPRVDRRSKLEFVASMAELQQRARAFDLAIENVYGRTRRALARYGGADASANYETIAAAVAARSGRNRQEIESLMRECEDAISGTPVTPRTSLALVARLRELERALGIRMRAREIRQAKNL